ncbi:hypothetical protein C0J52_25980 [Blattella germanica]|nr:hypothetical protein C0J52_25980 [Blattella germanica]
MLLVLMSLVLHSQGGQLNLDPIKLAITYGTFGAYIIVPLFLMAGFIIGEVTPKLLVGYNLFGACLFVLVGSIGFGSYWNLEQNLGQLPANWNIAGIENVNNLTLGSAILCFLNAFLYGIDTVIEGVILHDST